jgi:hypothetical protein
MAQNNAQNAAIGGSVLGSDGEMNVLLTYVMGCSPWTVTDLADPGSRSPSLALNELQAAAWQQSPVALIPGIFWSNCVANRIAGDAMVTVNGHPNLNKLNSYRKGLNQPTVSSLDQVIPIPIFHSNIPGE